MGDNLISAVAVCALSLTLIGASLLLPCAPQATAILSEQYSVEAGTSLSHEQIVELALIVRKFTIKGKAAESLPVGADSSTTLSTDSIQHLEDVHTVLQMLPFVIGGAMTVSVLCLLTEGIRRGRRRIGGIIMATGAMVLVLLASSFSWALADFEAFFSWFHSLFFTQGTWLFPADSLLIRMYPEAFWVGMGIIWASTMCVLLMICLVIGRVLLRRDIRP